MKTATLHQKAFLNAGVIGELKIGGLTLQTLETGQCLEKGEHFLKPHPNGRFCIGDDYFVLMDRNGPYRNKGLCLGMKWDTRSFDVMQKGDAMQSLLRLVGEGMKIVVTRPDTEFQEMVAYRDSQIKALKDVNALDAKSASEEFAAWRAERDQELSEVKAALKWAVAQTSPGKAATKAQAQETINKVLSEGEGDESNGDDSGSAVPAGE